MGRGSPPPGALRLLLLRGGVVLLLLLLSEGRSESSSSHSLCYFYTALSDPGQGLPQFIAEGYLDDQPITHYDSHTQKKVPVAPWMRQVDRDDPKYWDTESQTLRASEQLFRRELVMLQDRYNQRNSTELHTWQLMYGCEVGPEGHPREGFWQYAYDGEDFISLDVKTLTWTASVPEARISKQKLDTWLYKSDQNKAYLEHTCVDWLQKYLGYGKVTLQRTEAPTVRVARKKGFDGLETLVCRLHGFYPKEIEVTWTKDGEDKRLETSSGGVVPNSDGTFHTWLSIEVDPKERDHYWCHVEHDGLKEPLDMAWEDPGPNLGLILGIVGGVFLAALLLGGAAGVALCMRRQKGLDYKTAPENASHRSSSTSSWPLVGKQGI